MKDEPNVPGTQWQWVSGRQERFQDALLRNRNQQSGLLPRPDLVPRSPYSLTEEERVNIMGKGMYLKPSLNGQLIELRLVLIKSVAIFVWKVCGWALQTLIITKRNNLDLSCSKLNCFTWSHFFSTRSNGSSPPIGCTSLGKEDQSSLTSPSFSGLPDSSIFEESSSRPVDSLTLARTRSTSCCCDTKKLYRLNHNNF